MLREAVSRAKDLISLKNPDLKGEEKEIVSKMIGIGAVKYADLSTDRARDYTFDWEKMLSFEGNTAPYLQYSHARICRIFSLSIMDRDDVKDANVIIGTEEELNLARCIMNFSEVVDNASSTLHPHKLCTHIHSTSSAFASFYEACPILKTEDEALMKSRLALCDLTARSISIGLGLLGIQSPEKM